MSAKIYECRWANCHLDFKEVDQYKEHIEAHIEANPAQPVSDIARYRRAAGFGPSSSASQSEFNYLNTQESLHKAMSPPTQFQGKAGARTGFSALGLGAEASPSYSPLLPSPSMSAMIRNVNSPRRSQKRAQEILFSPISGLAKDASVATPRDDAFSPAPPQSPPIQSQTNSLGHEVTKSSVQAMSQTSDDETPTENTRKRKQGVMFNEPTTPANKKKKKNPKTPFPDPDLDSSEEEEEDAQADEDPYVIATQAPAGSSWDGLSTPEFEDDPDAPSNIFLQDLDGTGEAHIEEVDEEREVASQLGDAPNT